MMMKSFIHFFNLQTELEQRNSNPIFPRETKITNSPSLASSSNRFLASALDQRIMKQSSEDCRRLLQQVREIK
jgi:hypothetical protein